MPSLTVGLLHKRPQRGAVSRYPSYHTTRGIALLTGPRYPSCHAIRRITLSVVSHYPRGHPIRRITLSVVSHYPRGHPIRRIMLYAVARPLGRAPARQSKCDDGALPLSLLSCPEIPAPQGAVADYSHAESSERRGIRGGGSRTRAADIAQGTCAVGGVILPYRVHVVYEIRADTPDHPNLAVGKEIHAY